MILKNIKVRNTEVPNSPFNGIILSTSEDNLLEIDLENKLVFDNIDGVMFEGEWHKRMLDFVEVLKKIREYELKTFIDTQLTMSEFKTRLGIASYEKVNDVKLSRRTIADYNIPMMEFIGSMILDYYLRHTGYHIASKEKDGYTLNHIKMADGEEDGE